MSVNTFLQPQSTNTVCRITLSTLSRKLCHVSTTIRSECSEHVLCIILYVNNRWEHYDLLWSTLTNKSNFFLIYIKMIRERERERKQLNIFERKVYRRILGPVYDNEKENWRILNNKEITQLFKNPL